MVYVGEGGKNLWYMHLDAGVGFKNWRGNQPVRVSGSNAILQSDYRPALAVLNGTMHLIYEAHGGTQLWWSWFDGTSWFGNIPLPMEIQRPLQQPGEIQQCEPVLCVDANGEMHLAFHDYLQPQVPGRNKNEIWHAAYKQQSREPSLGDWSAPDRIASDLNHPGLDWFGRTFSVTALIADNVPGSGQLLITRGLSGAWGLFEPLIVGGNTALSNLGAVLLKFNGLLYAIYPGQGSQHRKIWYTWIDAGGLPIAQEQVKAANWSAMTSAPIAAAVFNNELCIAYKGESSDNAWFAHGS